jgi:hypothetical protein
MTLPAAYWVLRVGPVLHRRTAPPGIRFERWDRVERRWVEDMEWYSDVIDGDMGYDDVTEDEARERFPAAFRTEQGPR